MLSKGNPDRKIYLRVNTVSQIIVSILLLAALLATCNPYEPYSDTHFYVQAEVDPGNSLISANVQIVLVASREYRDSISFALNPGVEIQSLTAQELEHYQFGEYHHGRLVLFIEEHVQPGDQLHISLSYSGKLTGNKNAGSGQDHGTGYGPDNSGKLILDNSLLWLPVNRDTRSMTFMGKFALPGEWILSQPESGTGKHGKWLVQVVDPGEIPEIVFSRIKTNKNIK